MAIKFLVIEILTILMGVVFGITYPGKNLKESLIAGGAFWLASQIILAL